MAYRLATNHFRGSFVDKRESEYGPKWQYVGQRSYACKLGFSIYKSCTILQATIHLKLLIIETGHV